MSQAYIRVISRSRRSLTLHIEPGSCFTISKGLATESSDGKKASNSSKNGRTPLSWDQSKTVLQDKLNQSTSWVQNSVANWQSGKQPGQTNTIVVEGADGTEWYAKRVNFWMKQYEDFVGLTEVKHAQGKVVELERRFVEQQDARREAQSSITAIQTKIKEIHGELEKTYRGEDKYLTLVTQEHQVLKEEKALLSDFQQMEKRERECFAVLSNAVRDSHEKERAQAEKTKYWSVLGSIIGTCLGILGTTINNRMRMRELRELVVKSASGEKMLEVTDQLGHNLNAHEVRLKELVTQIHHTIIDSKLSVDKIGEMRLVFDSLEQTANKFSANELKNLLMSIGLKSDKLFQSVLQQQRSLQDKLNGLEKAFGEQIGTIKSSNLTGQQINAYMLHETERNKKLEQSFEGLYSNQKHILSHLEERIKGTENGVRDIIMLINTARSAANTRREKEKTLLQDMDTTLLDKIEDILDAHEDHNRWALFGSLFIVLPLIVYAFRN